jgi:hypothetical protein
MVAAYPITVIQTDAQAGKTIDRPCINNRKHEWLFQYNSFEKDPKSFYLCQTCHLIVATRIGHLPITQASNN